MTNAEIKIEVADGSNKADLQNQTIVVTLNNREVTFSDRKATGLEIKQTAISQQVPIQTDFALFEIKGHGNLKQVGDQELVVLHPHQEFRALAPDDNS